MLPSSYRRRLRTKDVIQTNFPESWHRSVTKSSTQTYTRVDFKGSKKTTAYLPVLNRERTRTHHSSRVSGQINMVLKRLSEIDKREQEENEINKKKLELVHYPEKRDTPIPAKLIKQCSKLSLKNTQRLQVIKEKKEPKQIIIDTPENLTRERVLVLVNALMKDKRMAHCYRRNPNRIEILPPVTCDGMPAWNQELRKDIVVIVPIKSLRYLKWNYSVTDIGYIEVNLPKKMPKRTDVYAPLRADDHEHLSTSRLNKALVEIFVEGIKHVRFGESSLVPDVNFDYLNDTVELVYTKQLRVPLIPAIHLSQEDPLYVIRPNFPDLDPTSDIIFRACFLVQEERILNSISATDHGLRFDALKVIHTLCKQDWRLQAITAYQLKNVLMHDIDFEIDHSPRWQRLSRDVCVQSVLKRLLYFVKKRSLPHFFQSDLNLFKCIPENYLLLMRTPLERLVSNGPQLLRDLQRASRNNDESETSSESDEDWW